MATQTWNIDPSHSTVGFTVRHLVISKVHGSFNKFSGTIVLDEQNPSASKVTAQIEATSIDTKDDKRDGHLRSADFFDVEKFPTLTFESTRVEKADGNAYRVTGDLTLHGVKKAITLEAELLGTGKDPWGNQRAGFSAQVSLQRKDFGLNWNQALEAGGVLVGEKVDIHLDIEAVKAA
jgi:polyisoprenoid-binding protein YceI